MFGLPNTHRAHQGLHCANHVRIPRGTLLFQNLLKIKPEIPVKLSRDDVKLLLEYRERFGKGVRQRSVRADTTKYNAGTLPLHLYDNRPLPNCSNIEFTQQQLEQNPQDQSEQSVSTETPALQDSVSSLYLVDDYLAIVLEGNICIGRILSTVNEKSTTCSLKIYTEDSGLIYNTSCEVFLTYLVTWLAGGGIHIQICKLRNA